MPYVNVPRDLTKVKTKVALNLTKRQLVCFGLAAAIGIPIYLLTHRTIGNDIAVLLMIGLMLPFFFLAMFERNGQAAEKIIRNYLRAKIWPGKRIYKTENLYKYLHEGGINATIQKNETTGTASARERPAGKKR